MKRHPGHDKSIDIGIIGGGQLGRMMAERAAKLGLTTGVLDPAPDCPSAPLAALHIQASFDDPASLRRLAERSRVTTFDIEAGHAAELARLESEGHTILPSPRVLGIIQDKLKQRWFLAEHGLPVPRFQDLPEPSLEALQSFGFPLVQKARRGGYDGRGVAILNNENDFESRLQAPSMIEEKIDLAHELAVLVARSRTAEMVSYPVCELFPDPATQVLEGLVFPAQAPQSLLGEAQELACQAVAALDGVGIFAVELFLDMRGRLSINEISPRPHNAGHVTIEAATTCQFEQHLRAVLGWPLGETTAIRPAAMVNLLGPSGVEGPYRVDNRDQVLQVGGVRLHLYGKTRVRPGRKMGHLTALDEDPFLALARARRARDLVRFSPLAELAA